MARALAVAGDAHHALVLALFLGEEGRDPALLRPRHAGDQRPIDFARRARAEGLGERRGGKARLGDQQAAGGVLVEPVHQARTLAVAWIARHRLPSTPSRCRRAGAVSGRTASPIGLLSTSTSSSSYSVIDLMKARSFWSLASSRGFGGSILSGGMRIAWPFCRRSLGCARLAVHPHLAFADDALDGRTIALPDNALLESGRAACVARRRRR